MKEKGNECIFVGYSTQSRVYRVFNKRTKVIMESFHRMALEHAIKRQVNVPQADRTVITSNELDLLFSSMFDELLNGSSKVVSKSSAISSADAPNQRQHHTTPLNNHTTPASMCQVPTLVPTVSSSKNINQAETYAENGQVLDDEFINIFCTPVQDQGETSSCHVDSSNMHTFYQRYPSEHSWTKDHPLDEDENPARANIKQALGRKIVTIWFTLIVLSALRRSDNENTPVQLEDGNPARANVKQALGRPYALSWKPCQEDSLNLPDQRYIVGVVASFQLSRIHI
nr:hypothetical protein [Tanacetum cinerariifolium]